MRLNPMVKRMLAGFTNLVFLLAWSSPARAAGFGIVEHGTRAMGRGGAFVATADDGSALFYNPAGLADISGNVFQNEFVLTYRRSRFEDVNGKDDTIRGVHVNPNAFFVHDTASPRWNWGVGVFVPFGSSTDWNDRGPLRYEATHSELKTLVVNPACGIKLTEDLSFGLGLDIYQSSVESRKKIDYGKNINQSGAFDAEYELKAPDTYALGANAGILYHLDENRRIGASYRSRFTMYYEGTGFIRDIPSFVSASPELSSPVTSEYNYPDEIMFGYGQRISPQWDFGFDIQWTNWSQYKDVDLIFADRPTWNTYAPKNYHDSLIYKLGLEYFRNDHLSFRGGYAYSTSPVPEETFQPSNPDASRNTVYFGMGYKKKDLSFDVAASLTLFNDRTVDNDIGSSSGISIDGTYKSFIPQISASLGMKF